MESNKRLADRYIKASAYAMAAYVKEALRKDLGFGDAGAIVIPIRPSDSLVSELRVTQASSSVGIVLSNTLTSCVNPYYIVIKT